MSFEPNAVEYCSCHNCFCTPKSKLWLKLAWMSYIIKNNPFERISYILYTFTYFWASN